MSEKEKMIAGELYDPADSILYSERMLAKSRLFEINQLSPLQLEQRNQLFKQLFGKTAQNFHLELPFYCDYGYNIEIGENFYANYHCTILDCAKVTIGNNVVIGAGSVVTKSIPDNCIAVGNPCKVLRALSEHDKIYYFKQRKF